MCMDDILLAGKDDERVAAIKQAFSHEFQLKVMSYFLGMKVVGPLYSLYSCN